MNIRKVKKPSLTHIEQIKYIYVNEVITLNPEWLKYKKKQPSLTLEEIEEARRSNIIAEISASSSRRYQLTNGLLQKNSEFGLTHAEIETKRTEIVSKLPEVQGLLDCFNDINLPKEILFTAMSYITTNLILEINYSIAKKIYFDEKLEKQKSSAITDFSHVRSPHCFFPLVKTLDKRAKAVIDKIKAAADEAEIITLLQKESWCPAKHKNDQYPEVVRSCLNKIKR